jgi:hypothetical protein
VRHFSAATALLDRGYGRPAQSLDLHLSADAVTKRLSEMTDAELAALEARMITIPGSLALEHVDEPQADGDNDNSRRRRTLFRSTRLPGRIGCPWQCGGA